MFLNLPLPVSIFLFLAAAAAVAYFGSRLTQLADRLADVTGLGEAVSGALLLGAATSLPGIVTSVAAAHEGLPELSISNAIGGIAGQTAFLAVADIAYRRANLEHAAASAPNMMQGGLLVSLLALPMLAAFTPEALIFEVHPATPLMLAVYIHGIRMVHDSHFHPMWNPQVTDETRTDEPDEAAGSGPHLRSLALQFVGLASIVGAAGWTVYRTAVNILRDTGISETVVGMLLTALVTSMPELVTSLAAVRRGALTLAVSGILGGNAFDTLFLGFSDIAYRDGSIYHAASSQQLFLIALSILMSSTLLVGLLRREKHGIANIGFESFAVVMLYLMGVVLVLVPA